jgi:hypothetical protein
MNFIQLILPVVIMTSCNQVAEEQQAENQNLAESSTVDSLVVKETKDTSLNLTERFSGTVNNVNIIFGHERYIRYRLSENEKISTGDLNTERGYGDDINATVYVLDHAKPEAEQKYFVRLTNGKILMLDAKRKIIPGSELKLERF